MPYFEFVGDGFVPKFIVTTLLIAVCLLTAQNGVAQITFGAPVDYAVGVTPGAVATGDFNGDGKLDLAVANTGSNDVSILLGNGDGTFQTAVNYSVGLDPISIAVTDLNGDHNQDLAIAFHGDVPSQQRGGVSLLLGNGDGTFRPTPGLASNDYPQAIAAGDFEGDGKPDLAVANIDAGVSVFLGNGDGTFRSALDYSVTGDPACIVIGDFNADGRRDLLVTTSYSPAPDELAGKASVLLGNGDGTFQAATETALGGSGSSCVAGDFNGDHRLDLAFITKANIFSVPSIAVALGHGDGTFGTTALVDATNFDSFLTVDDINGDGSPDLVGLSHSVVPAARIFLSQGNSTFQLAQTIVFDQFGPAAVAIGDFNGDQLHDLALTMTPQNVVSILANTTTDFTLSASSLAPAKVKPGQSATSTLNLLAANGFTGLISFTCSVQPTPTLAPQCSVTPNSANPGTPATLTVTTTGPSAVLHFPLRGSTTFALWLPFVGTIFSFGIGQASRSRHKRFATLFLLCIGLVLMFQVACGGGGGGDGPGSRGTPTGNYIITVKGAAGSMQHTTSMAIAVQ